MLHDLIQLLIMISILFGIMFIGGYWCQWYIWKDYKKMTLDEQKAFVKRMKENNDIVYRENQYVH